MLCKLQQRIKNGEPNKSKIERKKKILKICDGFKSTLQIEIEK